MDLCGYLKCSIINNTMILYDEIIILYLEVKTIIILW